MTYLEILQSPQWQSKRIEILKRDNYTCQRCGVDQKTNLPTWEIVLRSGVCHERILGEAYTSINVYSWQHLDFASIEMCNFSQSPIKCKTTVNSSQLDKKISCSLLVNFFADEHKMSSTFVGSLLPQKAHNLPDKDSLIKFIKVAPLGVGCAHKCSKP